MTMNETAAPECNPLPRRPRARSLLAAWLLALATPLLLSAAATPRPMPSASAPAAKGDVEDFIFFTSFEPRSGDIFRLDTRLPMPGWRIAETQVVVIAVELIEGVGGGEPLAGVVVTLDGVNVSSRCVVEQASIYCDGITALATGVHHVGVRVGEERIGWSFSTVGAPRITPLTPANAQLPPGTRPVLSAQFHDDTFAIAASGVQLLVGEENVTAQAQISFDGDHRGSVSFQPAVAPATGVHYVELRVTNSEGMGSAVATLFNMLPEKTYQVQFVQPGGPQSVTEPELDLIVRAGANRSDVSELTIAGEVAMFENHVDGLDEFHHRITLQPGDNAVVARARFDDGHVEESTLQLTYDAPPRVTLISPQDWQTLGPVAGGNGPVPGGSTDLTGSVERPVVVTGRVSRPVKAVSINQQQATLDADGQGFRFERFLLHEGTNLISANATDLHGRVGTAQITVYLDQTAPLLTVEGPLDDAVTSASEIDVRGVVNDAVEGGINAPEPGVTVRNAANQQSVAATVSDRYYLSRSVPLEIGANALTVTATDALGNARSRSLRVTRVAAGSSRVTRLGGDRQSGLIGGALAQPLSVAAIDEQGLPLAAHALHFDILRGAGALGTAAGQVARPDGITPARNLVVTTDHEGRAEVWLTLGSEAAEAGNMVRVWSPQLAEDVMFTATGLRDAPANVLVSGAAGSQYVQTLSQPVEALTAVVVDRERNAMTGASVRFVIDDGDAEFTAASAVNGTVSAGGRAITVAADKNGLASVRPFTGRTPGTVRIRAYVQLAPDDVIGNAVFNLIVLERGEGPTGFSGIVLDHGGTPLAGVRLSITRTPLSTVSDASGRFQFDDQVPPGKIDLDVDGRALQSVQNGQTVEYPRLHFETAVIQGRMNQLPHPIYLPPVSRAQARIVGGDEDVRITVPGLEGFEMTVKANSVTFPDGSRVGPVVVTPVHVDRLPMVPPGPSSVFSAVAWTIQPTNTRFDPPIEVKIPNADGFKAGETTSIVQWDHDLAAFVPMGRGTVNESATQIVTDPGSGITKAGWGGGGGPPPPQTCATNPPPLTCRGSDCSPCPDCRAEAGRPCPSCAPDPSANGRRCENNACKSCQEGACRKIPLYRDGRAADPPAKLEFAVEDVQIPLDPAYNGEFRGYRKNSYAGLANPGIYGEWDVKIVPYCTPDGRWKFYVSEAKITSKIMMNTNIPRKTLNADVMRQLDAGLAGRPDAEYCTLYDSLHHDLMVLAASSFATPFQVHPIKDLRALGVRGSAYCNGPCMNKPSTHAHELVHYERFRRITRGQWASARNLIEQIEVPLLPGDHPTAAVERANTRLESLLEQFQQRVIETATQEANQGQAGGNGLVHYDPYTFYYCSMGQLYQPEWELLKVLRERHSCTRETPRPGICPEVQAN